MNFAAIYLISLQVVCVHTYEYYLAFQENGVLMGEVAVGRIYLVNPGVTDASVQVTTPLISGGLSEALTVSAGAPSFVTVPNIYQCAISGLENKGIKVVSDQELIVQGINIGNMATDAFQVPDPSQLGHVYVAASYKFTPSNSYQGPYEVMVLGTTSGATSVQVELHGPYVLSVNFDGASYTNGDVISFTLNFMETAQIQCVWGAGGDLSGTVVTSDKPVFVTSGAAFSSVSTLEWPDHLVSTLPPAERLGTDYVFSSVVGRTAGDMIRIIGLLDGTTVDIYRDDGNVMVNSQVVNAFAVFDYDTSALSIPREYHVSSDKPVVVIQLAKCYSSETGNSNTDPFMIYHEAVTSFRSSDYTFTTMASTAGPYANRVQIVVETAAKSGVLVDGSAPTGTWSELTSMPYSVLVQSVVEGKHRVHHNGNALLSVLFYGQMNKESYASIAQPTPGTYTFIPTALSLLNALYPPTTESPTTEAATTVSVSLPGCENGFFVKLFSGKEVTDGAVTLACSTRYSPSSCALMCVQSFPQCDGFQFDTVTKICCTFKASTYSTSAAPNTDIWRLSNCN